MVAPQTYTYLPLHPQLRLSANNSHFCDAIFCIFFENFLKPTNSKYPKYRWWLSTPDLYLHSHPQIWLSARNFYFLRRNFLHFLLKLVKTTTSKIPKIQFLRLRLTLAPLEVAFCQKLSFSATQFFAFPATHSESLIKRVLGKKYSYFQSKRNCLCLGFSSCFRYMSQGIALQIERFILVFYCLRFNLLLWLRWTDVTRFATKQQVLLLKILL